MNGNYYEVESILSVIEQSVNQLSAAFAGGKEQESKNYFKFRVSPKISTPNFRAESAGGDNWQDD